MTYFGPVLLVGVIAYLMSDGRTVVKSQDPDQDGQLLNLFVFTFLSMPYLRQDDLVVG